jgi:TIR domain
MSRSDYHAWIFVSHASDDLIQVRKVRNYLEEKGASPILFHLLALKEPEQFWPVIEKEIEARNFFLYCESEIARMREWVQRERAAVEAVAKVRPVRIGVIRVDGPQLELAELDAFLATIRVFPSFSPGDSEQVRPYLDALEKAGFQVFDPLSLVGSADLREIKSELELAARDGWIVVFLSHGSVRSPWVRSELAAAQTLGARFIAVAIEPKVTTPGLFAIEIFDGTRDPIGAPTRLVAEMLQRRR